MKRSQFHAQQLYVTTTCLCLVWTSWTNSCLITLLHSEEPSSGGRKFSGDLLILQLWIIFHQNNPDSKTKSQREFRLELVKQLAQPLLDLKASTDCPGILIGKGRKSPSPDKCLSGKHFPYKSEEKGRCAVCRRHKSPTGKKTDNKTKNYCSKCNEHLCFGACFESFHTKASY